MPKEDEMILNDFDARFFRQISIALAKLAIVLFVVSCILWVVHYATNNAPEALQTQSELLTLYDQIELGMPLESVLALSIPECLSRTDHTNGDSGEIEIATPLIWNFSNWVLHIAFEEASVVGIYIGTPDSAGEHPSNAPPDIFAPDRVPKHRERYAPAPSW